MSLLTASVFLGADPNQSLAQRALPLQGGVGFAVAAGPFGVAVPAARLRPWAVRAPGSGPALVARARESADMHAFRTVSRIIEIQSPVCVTALVPLCSYVFFNYIPCCRAQKTASSKLLESTETGLSTANHKQNLKRSNAICWCANLQPRCV